MKFGGLSESDVEKIEAILNAEKISFSVSSDNEIAEFNTSSMKNDLRHFSPPNISTHILQISIEDEDFGKISESGKSRLLDLGITDQVPSAEDFKPFTGHTIQKELADKPNKMVVSNFKHQLILSLIGLLLYGIYILVMKK